MITNKDVRIENGNIVINGDKYPLDGQSPEAIMQIVKDNSDTTPTENSTAPITSGGVYTALGSKQDTLTFDNVPTENSTNPVKSGGVFDKFKEIHPTADKLTTDVFESNSSVDIVIVLNETGNDDYKGIVVNDKNGNERYKLYFTGGHLKFLSKAADGTTIVDTIIA